LQTGVVTSTKFATLSICFTFTLQTSFKTVTRERQLAASISQVGNSALQPASAQTCLSTQLHVGREEREMAFQTVTLLNKVNRSVARSKMTEVTIDMVGE